MEEIGDCFVFFTDIRWRISTDGTQPEAVFQPAILADSFWPGPCLPHLRRKQSSRNQTLVAKGSLLGLPPAHTPGHYAQFATMCSWLCLGSDLLESTRHRSERGTEELDIVSEGSAGRVDICDSCVMASARITLRYAGPIGAGFMCARIARSTWVGPERRSMCAPPATPGCDMPA